MSPGKDEDLEQYRRRRNFRSTPEPSSGEPSGEAPIFVVQKHDASTLHYDFRFELEGVLKSWAVPKGPSTNPARRRLAIPTEDHPLEYADFEGTIPEDQYGGGTVLVWDRGTYRNITEKDGKAVPAAEALREGLVSLWLEGEKLQGGYTLVRTGSGEDARWLLIKKKDERADPKANPVEERPESVLSGRTLEQIEQEAQ